MTREEAIKDIEECVIPYVGGISLRMAVEDMKEMDRLAKAEPVLKEPQRPHGEWIETYYSIDGVGASEFECSLCGRKIKTYGATDNFCPNCGADMRGDEK